MPCERTHLLRLLIAACVAVASAVPFASQAARPPAVALVALMQGPVRITPANARASRDLVLFERLAAGARLESGPSSVVTIVFGSGRRFRIGAYSLARVTNDALIAEKGEVERLPDIPPLPLLPPAEPGVLRQRVAAVRIRTHEFDALYPGSGASVLADSVSLSLRTDREYGAYDVEVEDSRGTVVFSTRAAEPRVAVPPGTLAGGREYRWRVSAKTAAGNLVRGEAVFTTLPPRMTRDRAKLREALGSDAAQAAWLAEIDLALGLVREARDGFRRAPAHGSAVIADRLEALDRLLGEAAPVARR